MYKKFQRCVYNVRKSFFCSKIQQVNGQMIEKDNSYFIVYMNYFFMV